MILILICIFVLVLSYILSEKADTIDDGIWFVLLMMISGITLLIMIITVAVNHIGIDAQIEKSRIEYQSLVKRYEIINSDYEDVSKSDVIKDIAEWNKEVYSAKYWSSNPWTNIFYSRRYVDSLQYIVTDESQ